MTLPKKKSRSITVDNTQYRWMVSMLQHMLYLTIEAEDDPGQTFQALFEPHDQFKREADGTGHLEIDVFSNRNMGHRANLVILRDGEWQLYYDHWCANRLGRASIKCRFVKHIKKTSFPMP